MYMHMYLHVLVYIHVPIRPVLPPSFPPFLPPSLIVPLFQAAAKKSKMDKDDEERSQKMIEEQITRALASKGEEVSRDGTQKPALAILEGGGGVVVCTLAYGVHTELYTILV